MKDLFLFIYCDSTDGLGVIVVSDSFADAEKAYKEASIDISKLIPATGNVGIWSRDGGLFSYPQVMREDLELNRVYIV